jgi:7-cyano-7-deazaguanine synthase
MQDKCIVLLSGGQDSTTCLYWALERFTNVVAVGFDYGQSHVVELERAKKIAKDAGVEYRIINAKGLLAKSSLTENGDHNQQSYVNPDLPASFTAGRNILFLTVAASLGAELGINNLVTGVCQTDYSGYPDCRRDTIDALEETLTLGVGNGNYIIYTPLMYLTKAETFKMAKELGVLDIIINDTMTDYDGANTKHEWGYGNLDNPASNLRAKGYYEAKEKGWL